MAKKSRVTLAKPEAVIANGGVPRCLSIAEGGINTSQIFTNFMSALMADIASMLVAPQYANAMVNAGGKLLKAKELELKYGMKDDNGNRILKLAEPVKKDDENK